MPCGDGAERLVGTLENSLRPDVDPRSRSHLPVHDEAPALEIAEHLPRGVPGDEVRIRDEHARGIRVRREYPDGFARLHEQRLVVRQHAQRATDRVERRPIPRGLAGAAIHDEIVRALRHFGVEVVHEHAERGFLHPTLTALRGAAGSPHRPGTRHDANFPSRMALATFSMSAVMGRSPVSAAEYWRTMA